MGQEFDGQVGVITGAASGIGLAVARFLAERGARIVGVDLNSSVGSVMASLPGRDHHGIEADLTLPGAAEEVIDEAVRIFGTVEILINSAGVAALAKALELTDEMWGTTIDVNLSASFKMARAAGRVMTNQGYGRIVNLASQASVVGLDQHVAYCASKAGIIGMTRVLSMEWAPHGVTVNAVSPTVVETPLGKKAWEGAKGEALKKRIPTGRFAQPDEVAALVAYLAGPDAGMMTGGNILIDGGYSSI